ncbi:hypothetical protein GUITHDRAFT_106014 [Guillardia theta CCMP2712]|uniref:Uncharacterized protein n=2 Tax=Guillardia theta TaxID=55529 RepID=L1JJS9_GUITC|nr:hypothetical protein GUITHDRAFT_106014 [Guillardia theta CCMP2712]EKX48409.1 hypothetical protein GUITHDRAFT_106014 [Guillardia theta CCMP2712]|eukprot:XP_005835389.1 hypothetical protein GUITHDRAFT_106014 [Guillardia theta CCMP2712]
MNMPMPGTPSAEVGAAVSEPTTKVSTLPNGVRVITESKASMGCSMAIFCATGSRSETLETHGASHFMQHLAYKATVDKSHFGLTRAIEKLGGHVACGSSRDCITYAGECLTSNAGQLFGLMAETFLYPRLEKLDIDNARTLVLADIQNSMKNGAFAVQDVLHTVAYQGQTLGAPMLCNPHAAEMMKGSVIEAFKQTTISPQRIIVSAVGVDHDRMVEYADKAFGEMQPRSVSELVAAQYGGGDCRVPSEPGQVHLALGFEGMPCTAKESVAAAVLQSLLGGGDQFSAGGPGKGLTSRIFRNVLSHPEILTATSFNVSYKDSGLFGIQATVNAHDAQMAITSVAEELTSLRGGFSEEEVTRAKNMTISALFLNLETMGIATEDLGRQIMYYGSRKDGKALAAEVSAITSQDLQKVAKQILSSPLSFAAYGDVAYVPSYSEIVALTRA